MKTIREQLNEIELQNKSIENIVSNRFEERDCENTQTLLEELNKHGFEAVDHEGIVEVTVENKHQTFEVLEVIGIHVNLDEKRNVITMCTPAITERGLDKQDVIELADILKRAIRSEDYLAELKVEVERLVCHYPLHNQCIS